MLSHAFDIQSTLHILDVTAKTAEDLHSACCLADMKNAEYPKRRDTVFFHHNTSMHWNVELLLDAYSTIG